MPLDELIEAAEQPIEQIYDLGRGKPPRQRGEVGDVREQDRRRVERVGDRARLLAEAVGDGAGEDVEQQALRLVALLLELAECKAPLMREEGEQGEDDAAGEDHVQGKHRTREPARQRGVHEEQLAADSRQEEGRDESDEPAHRRPHVQEDQGAERRQDAPHADHPGGEEPSSHHLPERWCQQDVEQLDRRQELHVVGAGEDEQ